MYDEMIGWFNDDDDDDARRVDVQAFCNLQQLIDNYGCIDLLLFFFFIVSKLSWAELNWNAFLPSGSAEDGDLETHHLFFSHHSSVLSRLLLLPGLDWRLDISFHQLYEEMICHGCNFRDERNRMGNDFYASHPTIHRTGEWKGTCIPDDVSVGCNYQFSAE